MLFLSHLPFVPDYEKAMQKQPVPEISISKENTFFNWVDFSINTTLKPIELVGDILWNFFSNPSRSDAIRFANNASKETGVRPEYLFAIYNQETSLGKNFGSCYLIDQDIFGYGVGVNLRAGNFSDRIMKPERDVKPFFIIMDELDRSPYFTAVSCPMKNIGWGGGMGHMQFIPSTWILVKDRVANALNKKVADPWNIEDAIWAAAFHLKDLGADHKKASNEREAACRYFSGKSCGENKVVLVKKKHKKPARKTMYVEHPIVARYANSVIKNAAYFQKKYWKETVTAKADTKPKTKKYIASKEKNSIKKQELAENFSKSKKRL
jgi:hypothetical protein